MCPSTTGARGASTERCGLARRCLPQPDRRGLIRVATSDGDRVMAVKVIVLVKQVPSPQHIRFDPDTRQLVREASRSS